MNLLWECEYCKRSRKFDEQTCIWDRRKKVDHFLQSSSHHHWTSHEHIRKISRCGRKHLRQEFGYGRLVKCVSWRHWNLRMKIGVQDKLSLAAEVFKQNNFRQWASIAQRLSDTYEEQFSKCLTATPTQLFTDAYETPLYCPKRSNWEERCETVNCQK